MLFLEGDTAVECFKGMYYFKAVSNTVPRWPLFNQGSHAEIDNQSDLSACKQGQDSAASRICEDVLGLQMLTHWCSAIVLLTVSNSFVSYDNINLLELQTE